MNLDPFRRAVLADAETRADEVLAAAEEEAAARVEAARHDARQATDSALDEGRRAAERALTSERIAARRRGHALELAAQREAIDGLRAAVLELLEVFRQRHDDEYELLLARLEDLVRQQIGPEANIARDPEGGGLVASHRGAVVDYTLPAIVDRAIADLGGDLSVLWE